MRRPTLATLALFLLALLFGWETRQAFLDTPGGQDNLATAGAWQPGAPLPDPDLPADPGQVVADIAARPLFRSDRQPFREQAASAVAARNYESEISRFTLLGVLGFADGPVGVVTSKSGNRTDRWELKAGDALPGFTVKEVGMDGMRLTSDGREFLLPLFAGAPAASGGAIRTEATHRGTASPAAAPGSPASAKPALSGARPGPANASPPAATATQPQNQPQTQEPNQPRMSPMYRPPPGLSPRFVPGRR